MQLMSDKTKFIAFIKSLEQKAEKMRIGNGKARAAISGQGEEWLYLTDLADTPQSKKWRPCEPSCRQQRRQWQHKISRQMKSTA